MKNLRKQYEFSGSINFHQMSTMTPEFIIDELNERLRRGERSGFVWRAIALLLALTDSDDAKLATAIEQIVECFDEKETKSFATRLVEAGGRAFDYRYSNQLDEWDKR